MMKMYTKNMRIMKDATPPHRFTVSDYPCILNVGDAPNMSKFMKNLLSILFIIKLINYNRSNSMNKKS